MNTYLLWAILVMQILNALGLTSLSNQSDKKNDFTKEDLEVKEETEEIHRARNRLPPQ